MKLYSVQDWCSVARQQIHELETTPWLSDKDQKKADNHIKRLERKWDQLLADNVVTVSSMPRPLT